MNSSSTLYPRDENLILDTSTSIVECNWGSNYEEADGDDSVCIVKKPKMKSSSSFKHLTRSQLIERLQAEESAHSATKSNMSTIKNEKLKHKIIRLSQRLLC